MVFLETERLIFREHRISDQTAFVKMQSDPAFRRFIGGRRWPIYEAKRRFRNDFLGKPTQMDDACAVELKETGEYIGYCGVKRESHVDGSLDDVGSLLIHISPSYWNRGLGTEAKRAFIDVAFRRLGLRLVYSEVEKGNEAMIRINGKLGMPLAREVVTPERTILIFEMTAEDWGKAENS